jgi:hypothetical protein
MLNWLGSGSVGRYGNARQIQRQSGIQIMGDRDNRRGAPGLGTDTLGRIQPSTGWLISGRWGSNHQAEHQEQHR